MPLLAQPLAIMRALARARARSLLKKVTKAKCTLFIAIARDDKLGGKCEDIWNIQWKAISTALLAV